MSDEETMALVVQGTCPFTRLPPLNKKVVRIFVSSTFSDTKEERNALMRDVYPKLAELCRDKFGLEFQVVDMRWGVPEHASDNHSTTELCLEEIRKCQELSVGPNFLVLLGHKYGYRPIPNVITEKEFACLKKAAMTADDKTWCMVEEWYLKDDNAIPNTYVLQSISSKLKDYNNAENVELRKKAQNDWWNIEQSLLTALRTHSKSAYKVKDLTEDEMHKFYMSVTENEMYNGVFRSRADPKDTCIAIVRTIPDIDQHLDHLQAPRFIDTMSGQAKIDIEAANFLKEIKDNRLKQWIPDNNLARVEIEWNASGANMSIENTESIDVAKYAQKFAKGRELTLVKHKEYLESLCTEFYQKASKLIRQGGIKNSKTYDELVTETLQHFHFAKIRCEVFEGREDVLKDVEVYLASDSRLPLVIHGSSGCGKTTVMARVFEILSTKVKQNCQPTSICTITTSNEVEVEMGKPEGASAQGYNLGTNEDGANKDPSAAFKEQPQEQPGMSNVPMPASTVIVMRFLGTTPLTSTIQQVLVTVCKQIARCNDCKWEEPDKFSDLVKSFHKMLELATKDRPVVLLIDSVDQLMPAYNAYNMDWLPSQLPEHVKVVVSTIDEGYPIYASLKEKIEPQGGQLIEIKSLGEQVGMTIIEKWLKLTKRNIQIDQQAVVKRALEICSLPLYARIVFDQIRRWRSFDKPSIEELETTIKGAISEQFQRMETKFGAHLVKHCLAYLTASRYGLSEMELEHVLSLDDELLGNIYKFWRPPIRRIPPLLWTRVRSEINYYIVERSADGILVLYWYHRQFIEATKARYLSDQKFSVHIHTTLAEYFLGKYGGGKAKPFEYTEQQKARFKLDSVKSLEDRKVPSQPYYTESKLSGESTVRFNQRKLSELPLHLLKSKQQALLKKEIFFNYEWIYAKMKCTSARAVLQEMELFMMADKSLRKDPELKLLIANLQLIRPYLSRFPDALPLELTGRLAKHVGHYPSLTSLIKQCDTTGVTHCPLTPILTMFSTADVGLKQNLNVRDSETWHEGGAMTCSRDFKTLYLVDYDFQGLSYIAIWDTQSGEKISQRTIKKPRDESVTEIYLDLLIDPSETMLIGLYKMKYYNRMNETRGCHRFTGNGHLEVIKIEDCTVLFSYEERLHKQDFYNSLCYIRDNWICCRFAWHLPVLNYKGERDKIQLTHPNLLSHDEKRFITICGKKVGVRSYAGEEGKVVGNVRTKTATIKQFETKDLQGEFSTSEDSVSIEITKDGGTVLLGDLAGNINVYEVNRLSEGKQFKIKRTLTLPRNIKIDQMDFKRKANEHLDVRSKLILSPDENFLLAVYQGPEDNSWEAVLYNLTTGKYISHIARDQPKMTKYPIFTYDGSVVVLAGLRTVELFFCATGEKVKVYEIDQDIRDIEVSKSSHQIALMLSKDIRFLDTNVVGQNLFNKNNRRKNKKTRKQPNQSDAESVVSLLPREQVTNTNIHKEVTLEAASAESTAQALEKEGIIESVDLGGLNSASSSRHLPLDTWETPDGSKVVQLLSKVQVIDTKDDEVKYTPKKGDTIMRSNPQQVTGQNTTDTFEIPNMSGSISGLAVFELLNGDRIVGDGNKTKLRVTSSIKGRMKIMTVPSVVSIGVLDQSGLNVKRMRKITVYQESIVAVANHLIVTCKKTSTCDFVKVYDINTGKQTATHSVGGSLGCARLSNDERRLFFATTERTLKIYSGQMLLTCELTLQLSHTPDTKKFVIRDLITFPQNSEVLVVKYSEEGVGGMAVNSYIHVNIPNRLRSPSMLVKPYFEDISKDGSIAIDNQLNMFDLPQGQLFKKLPYVNAGINMQLQVRISDDNKYVVFVDLNDNTLHVIKLTGQSAKHIASCFTHSPEMSSITGFSLRHFGRVILVRGPTTGLLLIRETVAHSEKTKICYQSEVQRSLSLIPSRAATSALQDADTIETNSVNNSLIALPPLGADGGALVQDFLSSIS